MEHMHDGHRQRLKKRAMDTDMQGLKPHEVLELLLYAVVPRQNLNPLAHAILRQFGTLMGVFSASVEELKTVPGVTTQMAEWLVCVGNAVDEYILSCRTDIQFENFYALTQYLRLLFRGKDRDRCHLICLNSMGHVLRMQAIGEKGTFATAAVRRSVVSEAIHCHADVVILALYREQPVFTPKEQTHLELLEAVLNRLDIMRVEFVVVNEHTVRRKQHKQAKKETDRILASEEFSLKWLDADEGEVYI